MNKKTKGDVAYQVLLWIVGEEDLSDDLLEDIARSWSSYLIPNNQKNMKMPHL